MARYDPHAHALEDNTFDWHCIVCHDIPMSPLHIEMQHLGGDVSVYTDLDGTLWSSVTNATHLSTSNVPLRNLKIVLGVRDLFAHFFVADNSKVELLVLIYAQFCSFLISLLC